MVASSGGRGFGDGFPNDPDRRDRDQTQNLADAAFHKAMAQVIRWANQSGSPVIVWRNGGVRAVPRETWKPRRKGRKAMTKTIHGKVHGKTIELDQDLGVPDGQKVEVTIQIVRTSPGTEPWGEGLRRCAGALAGIPGLDEDMQQILGESKTAGASTSARWTS
jgi:hypothetical protein